MLTNSEIGTRIKTARELRGMTLDDVASDVGVAKSTILRYEKGTIAKIKLPVIQSIARSLTVNPNWLIGNTDDPSVLSPAPSELSHALSDEEEELIKAFRSLNPEGRLAALASIRGLAHEPIYKKNSGDPSKLLESK